MVSSVGTPFETLVFAGQGAQPKKPDRMPLFKTMAYTFGLSVNFLWKARKGPVPFGDTDDMLTKWAGRIYRSGNASLSVLGRDEVDPSRACVVMSNHQSLLDIPSMFAAWPGHLRMVLKEELTRVPIWGSALKASGFIPIDRRDSKKAIEQLELAKIRIGEGISVWIAPEGTRSRDGSFGEFKKGGFHLATQLEVPIIPVWITGTDRVIPPDSFIVHYGGEVTVRIGRPIETRGVELDQLMKTVREEMLSLAET